MMELEEKRTMGGKEYLKILDSEGNQYFFSVSSDGLRVAPSTIGATDESGLTEACELVEQNGYEVDLTVGLPPEGFEY
jgi:hypothetical protein